MYFVYGRSNTRILPSSLILKLLWERNGTIAPNENQTILIPDAKVNTENETLAVQTIKTKRGRNQKGYNTRWVLFPKKQKCKSTPRSMLGEPVTGNLHSYRIMPIQPPRYRNWITPARESYIFL
jgi:hypothetical protein